MMTIDKQEDQEGITMLIVGCWLMVDLIKSTLKAITKCFSLAEMFHSREMSSS